MSNINLDEVPMSPDVDGENCTHRHEAAVSSIDERVGIPYGSVGSRFSSQQRGVSQLRGGMREALRGALSANSVRFVVVAGTGTILDLAVLTGARLVGLPLVAAVACGWTASVSLGFMLNRGWVFADGERRSGAAALSRYGALLALNAVVAILGVSFVMSLGMPYVLCRVLASGMLVVFNYLVCRSWVFRDPHSE